jgi:hypothetical protein
MTTFGPVFELSLPSYDRIPAFAGMTDCIGYRTVQFGGFIIMTKRPKDDCTMAGDRDNKRVGGEYPVRTDGGPEPEDPVGAFRGRGSGKYSTQQLIKERHAERHAENDND